MNAIVVLFVVVMLTVLFFENISFVVGDVTLMVCGVAYVFPVLFCVNSVSGIVVVRPLLAVSCEFTIMFEEFVIVTFADVSTPVSFLVVMSRYHCTMIVPGELSVIFISFLLNDTLRTVIEPAVAIAQ